MLVHLRHGAALIEVRACVVPRRIEPAARSPACLQQSATGRQATSRSLLLPIAAQAAGADRAIITAVAAVQGTQIEGTFWRHMAERLDNELVEGRVFYFSDGTVLARQSQVQQRRQRLQDQL